MALIDRLELRPWIQAYGEALNQSLPLVPAPPAPGRSMLYYSDWFATIDFAIETEDDTIPHH